MAWIFLLLLLIPISSVVSQQNYTPNSCTTHEEKTLYTCNGHHPSCKAFLMFTAKTPYTTLPAIAALTSSPQFQIMETNGIRTSPAFPDDQEIVVPVNCSCSGEYYQANTTYHIRDDSETYSSLALNTFQGLSTCDALRHSNVNKSEYNLHRGDELSIPLRCACPTREQAASGTKFLLTYPIGVGDTLYTLSKQFNVSMETVKEANNLLDEYSIIYPFTTLLFPLSHEPSRSQIVNRGHHIARSTLPATSAVGKNKTYKLILVAGGAAGAFSLAVLLFLVFVFLHRKRNSKFTSPEQGLTLEIAKLDSKLHRFEFYEVKKATGDFTSRNRINNSVYRGTFRGEAVAVKKRNRNADNEVKMLHQIYHFNIVKLHGFCEHRDELYLIYEYVENGTLQEWLAGTRSESQKSWNQLIRIALDVANGLLYLHKFTNPVRMHNNLSTRNILLDGKLRAKIAKFSLARTSNTSFISRVVGTKGYIAPECLDAGPVTPKVDIFAFGVVLLELITGKGPIFKQDGRERLLSASVAALMERQSAEIELTCFIEPRLAENGGMEYAIQIAKLSLSCSAQDPAERPDMVDVVSILQKLQFNIQKAKYTANKAMSIETGPTFSSSSVLSSI
ncbi:lysM domain receptor-like kinase 4 [Andrographis paniculata]|uniref:lysM domain receptor-like kinase 4 n=1 Tax=Andrographis paniculata TaxID=175694 RepID=UPI0021E77323|nr:lysM domain receptor-like kinase 4 [Andrographis paniculata]